ncbi:hypothetical protein Bpfe_001209 [Biomphalaria pfeifferi]|uniref:Fibronectin type-III domain-containing protein n=1 Tax=Biomphalaria pfeifferi TaxID=112525 RepID=A0AAD8C9Y4_BIOPF|nr:hypothetical protein Bpfe_001209 [Biomphalaria pfeifferi]
MLSFIIAISLKILLASAQTNDSLTCSTTERGKTSSVNLIWTPPQNFTNDMSLRINSSNFLLYNHWGWEPAHVCFNTSCQFTNTSINNTQIVTLSLIVAVTGRTTDNQVGFGSINNPLYFCELQIYKKIEKLICTHEVSFNQKLTIICTAFETFPEAICIILIKNKKNETINPSSFNNYTEIKNFSGYYTTHCLFTVSASTWSSGQYRVDLSIFPNVTNQIDSDSPIGIQILYNFFLGNKSVSDCSDVEYQSNVSCQCQSDNGTVKFELSWNSSQVSNKELRTKVCTSNFNTIDGSPTFPLILMVCSILASIAIMLFIVLLYQKFNSCARKERDLSNLQDTVDLKRETDTMCRQKLDISLGTEDLNQDIKTVKCFSTAEDEDLYSDIGTEYYILDDFAPYQNNTQKHEVIQN